MKTQKKSPSTILIILILFLCNIQTIFAQTYNQNGGTVTQTGKTYSTSTADTSAITVIGSGNFTLANSTVTKTGNSSNVSTSSQYGLNAGILVKTASKVTLTDVNITTNASGSNGIFATGSGSSITMTGGTISTTATGSHGIDVTYGGTITLKNVNIYTAGNGASAALSTDFGGGTLNVTGGIIKTTGTKSPGIYSTGSVTVTGARISASADNGGVIDGANSISLINTYLQGSTNGIKCHNTSSKSSVATISISGDTLNAMGGSGFYLNATSADISVSNGAKILASTNNILNVYSGSATFKASDVSLLGNFHTDVSSTLTLTLKSGSSLNGWINNADSAKLVSLTMETGSSWVVSATSYINGTITNPGISGSSVSNITGNGNNVYYTTNTNTSLGGLIYKLVNGGYLMPKGVTAVTDISDIEEFLQFRTYPNPFSDKTTVYIYLPQSSSVKLSILDITGKTIGIIRKGNLSAGSNEFDLSFDEKMSPGQYLLELSITNQKGKFIKINKAIKQ